MQNEWQTFFNGYAPQYESESFTKNTEFEVAFIIEELKLPPNSRILDAGCGIGRHSVELAKLGYRMTGVDISQGMLAQASAAAQNAGVEIELVCSNLADYQPGHQFDAAICLCEGALCLLGSGDDPYTRDEMILKTINQALVPGGMFIVTVLNACRLIRQKTDSDIQDGLLDLLTLTEHYAMEVDLGTGKQVVPVTERVYTPAEFIGMLKRSGFNVDHLWGGTAGAWLRQPMKLDEMEMMAIARRQ